MFLRAGTAALFGSCASAHYATVARRPIIRPIVWRSALTGLLACAAAALLALPSPAADEPAETTPAPAARTEPPPPAPRTAEVEGLVRNSSDVLALWEEALKTTGGTEEWCGKKWTSIEFAESGDAEFPSFSPDGRKLALETTLEQKGRKARFLCILSPGRLRRSGHEFLRVRTPSRMSGLLLPGAKAAGFRTFDAQVYFCWTSADEFVYFSRAEEKVCRGKWDDKAGHVDARKAADQAAITLHASGRTICFQDLQGIAQVVGGDMPRHVIKINEVRDQTGATIMNAMMPAICPTNPRVVAFIARAQESSSTDLCVMFDNRKIVRLVTRDGWEKLPSWAPDGKRLAFYSTRTNPARNEYGIWSARVDLSRREVGAMSTVSGNDQISAQDLRDSRRTGGPAWTPDSKQVVYFAKRHFPSRSGRAAYERYYLRTYDLRYGEDEGPLTVRLPESLALNSPGDITCSPAGALMAFSNAVNVDGRREFHVVLLLTDMSGAL